jgi:hypothetical protein
VSERFIFAVGTDPKTQAPVLIRAAVTQAGPVFVFTNRTSVAFGCRCKHDATEVHWSPDAAWEWFIGNQRAAIERAQAQIASAERAIEQASVKRIVAAVDDSPAWG